MLLGDPVQQVTLARTYDIGEWMQPGLSRIIQRAQPLGAKDVELLGIDTVLALAAIRETCATNHYGSWEVRAERGEIVGEMDFTQKLRDSSLLD